MDGWKIPELCLHVAESWGHRFWKRETVDGQGEQLQGFERLLRGAGETDRTARRALQKEDGPAGLPQQNEGLLGVRGPGARPSQSARNEPGAPSRPTSEARSPKPGAGTFAQKGGLTWPEAAGLWAQGKGKQVCIKLSTFLQEEQM